MATPTEPPICRTSELEPVASAILLRGMVEMRDGRERDEEAGEADPLDDAAARRCRRRGLQRVVAHLEGADDEQDDAEADDEPRRDLVVERPTMGVTSIMTSVRGMSARPDCMAVKPSTSCMKTGRRNMIDMSIANMTPPMSVPEGKTGP